MAGIIRRGITPELRSGLDANGFVILDMGYFRPLKITREFLDDLDAYDVFRLFRPGMAELAMVHGTADEVAPIGDARRFAQLSGAAFTEIEGADHRFTNPGGMNRVADAAARFFETPAKEKVLIKRLPQPVMPEALELVLDVFMKFEARDYREEGIRTFRSFITSPEMTGGLVFYGAFDGDKIIGMASEKNHNHICLLFVDKDYHRKGVASAMMREMVVALKLKGADQITVNSSPFAIPFYHNFGFTETGEEQTLNGITFTPMVYNPKELWDVYDKNREKTGKIIERGPTRKDEYHLVVNVWIRNFKGEYLVSKRTPNKKDPLMWECTGGSAVIGEDSLTASVREAEEELGVKLNPKDGKLIASIVRNKYPDFLDAWLFKQDVDINKVVLQEGETCDAMWADKNKILKMIDEGTFIGRDCNPYIDEFFEKEG
jgi:GNAT superfamily N-acetyltransferase/8-oxo-dGTP pyrophosphatase MutT (NUDIX family)